VKHLSFQKKDHDIVSIYLKHSCQCVEQTHIFGYVAWSQCGKLINLYFAESFYVKNGQSLPSVVCLAFLLKHY